MISFFNRIGNSWIAKIIFALLGLSMMAFWGLGGISNTSSSDTTALKVGNRSASLQEVGRTFDQERNKMAKIAGGYFSPKQAIEAGLLDQVLQQLVARETKAQIQEKIGLTASDNAVRKYIEKNPVFADNLGHFDINLFYAYLSQLGINQTELAHQLRSELAFRHLTDSVKNTAPISPKLMTIAAQSRKEKRQIESALIKEVTLGTPSQQELQDYYEAYRDEFATPEYRTLRIAFLNPNEVSNNKEEAYDKMYATSRELEDLLGGGTPLKEACATLKINNMKVVTVDMAGKNKEGNTPEKTLIKNPILEEAFLLSEGESTSLVDFENGFMVAEVEKVIPMGYKPFENVRKDVLTLWEAEQRKTKITQLADEITDSVRQGKGWKNILPNSKVISLSSTAFPKQVIDNLFKQNVGNEFVQRIPMNGGILIAVVKKIIPSTEQPTKEEIQTATQDWETDLLTAAQLDYAGQYPVTINQSAIQKTFSVYQKEND